MQGSKATKKEFIERDRIRRKNEILRSESHRRRIEKTVDNDRDCI